MLNRLIESVKAAGRNHKQVNEILVAPAEDQQGTAYPCLRIWPAPRVLSSERETRSNYYEIAIAVSDRHQDNGVSAVDAISDCDQIITDILATLQYIYHDTAGVKWEINGTIDPFYDAGADVSAGAVATLRCEVPYNADFCQVPSEDFDFPGLDITGEIIIDGGDADEVGELILDGGYG